MSTPTKRRLEASAHDPRAAAAARGREPAGLDEPDVGEPLELDGQLGAGEAGRRRRARRGRSGPSSRSRCRSCAWWAFSGRIDTRRTRTDLRRTCTGTRRPAASSAP